VGDGASDTCSGDSGGPALIKLNDGRFGVVAITARGPSPCAQENEPGTMTLVRMGVCWFLSSQATTIEGLEAPCAAEQMDDISMLNENQQQVLLMRPSVDLSNLNIQSLEWVSASSSVEHLNLAWNNITDAKPLLRLKQLKSVDIRGNEIDDKDLALALEQKGVRVIGAKSQTHNYHQTEFLRISALGAAAGTDQRSTILGLREILTKGTNLRRSADLATRVHIGLSGRDIRSLNPLEGLESAEVLLLNDNPLVTDLSPLVTLPRLRYLDVTGTGVAENSDNLATMQALKEHGVIIKTDL